MFLNFIAADGRVINLAMVVMIEDQSEVNDNDEVTKSVAVISTIGGDVITVHDDEAEFVLNRVNEIVAVNEAALTQLQVLAALLSEAAIHLRNQQQGVQP